MLKKKKGVGEKSNVLKLPALKTSSAKFSVSEINHVNIKSVESASYLCISRESDFQSKQMCQDSLES